MSAETVNMNTRWRGIRVAHAVGGRLRAVVVLCLFAGMADAADLKEARERWLRGNYAEAREIYQELAKDAKIAPAVAIGISKTHFSEGQFEEALKVVTSALAQSPKHPDLLARQAELLYERGRWDEAEKICVAAIAGRDENFLARWIQGQIYRDRGELQKADEAFRWFIRTYTQRSNDDKEVTDPDELLLIGMAGCERARWHHLADQFQFILTDIYGEAVKIEKAFWPAEVESARLLVEKSNRAAASKAIDRALAINPRCAEALALKGTAALQRFEMRDADQYVEQALEINPNLLVTLRLQADLHLSGGNLTEAKKTLDKARSINPRDEATLARLAAVADSKKQKGEFDALVKEVESYNQKPALFYTELAENYEGRKKYADAERFFGIAMKLQPNLSGAQTGLGMLYLRLGKEDEGYKILDKAFEADNFNVKVSNMLRVLDHLAKYGTKKTKHFIIRFDPQNDGILANVLADYLETIYDDLAKKFQYHPEGPFLIEIFNKHEMFSGRVVALPDLHTIGACTGRVVAMVSPRDKSKVIAKPFNWNRVLRHELVHVFNLEQTTFQVPHWLTEGLAVQYEGMGTPRSWNQLLAQKMQAGELMNLDNLLEKGFSRPGTEIWHLAYLQSLLYVQFLTKEHGDGAVAKMLAAYGEGLDTTSALEKAVGIKKAQFEAGYTKFLKERVAKTEVGRPPSKTFKQLKELHAKNPDDVEVASQLADRFYQLGNKKEARRLADLVLMKEMTHPLAGAVKAQLLLDGGDNDGALTLLAQCVKDDTKETRALKLYAKLLNEAKKHDEAIALMERGRANEPDDTYWLVQLAKAYLQSGDEPKLITLMREVAQTDPDDLTVRKKLVGLYRKAINHAEAENYARQALEIDVLDREMQDALLEALMAQNKMDEVERWKKLLER